MRCILKRAVELQDLSRDHHHALVLALRCSRAAASGDEAALRAIWEAAREALDDELEPHFGIEERTLFNPLLACGEDALVWRALQEHARLRELLTQPCQRETVRAFGALLRAHVRFEERELFPCAERTLSRAQLAMASTAHAARRPDEPRG